MNKHNVERTDEICADDAVGSGESDFIEGHGEICGRNLFRETTNTSAMNVTCPSCDHFLTVTRTFGPENCSECGAELAYKEENFDQEKLFCHIHGSKIPVKSRVEKNVKEREDGNSPLQYVNRG